MMVMSRLCALGALLLCLVLAPVRALTVVEESEANPIRRVVTMLQAMQKKVTEEGEKEKKLYEEFMCYCQKGNSELSTGISAAQTKVPAVSSDIQASEGKLVQTKEDLKTAQEDRTSAKSAMAEATALREKAAVAFAAESTEYKTNIAAIEGAVAALEKGMAGAFLQTTAADVLRKLALGKQDLLDADRQAIVAFLSGTSSQGYIPQSGEITGILKELGSEMKKSLADITATEEGEIKSYEDLKGAKTKEINALSSAIETKTQQIGVLGVSIVNLKEDLSDTQEALLADQKYLAELGKSCKTKTGEWEERQKTRADELVALAETIKVLNDDDALDLFKKTLPGASASFVQVDKSAAKLRTKALDVLHAAQRSAGKNNHVGLDFLVLALSGKRAAGKGGFDKVLKMIDNMVDVLKKEQVDDDDKKEYCAGQLDHADDKKKALERTISGTENSIQSSTESVATLTEEIAALEKGIKNLDKSVMEATEQRKEEHAECTQLLASNAAAKKLLAFAKNRLNKFYNPKLYRPPAKRELTEEERIFQNHGGELEPTAAPGAALVQISEHRHSRQQRSRQEPPPETWNAYAKKSGETTGVISMLDLLIKDLDKEITEATADEKNSQKEYETMMGESAAKRASDTKSLTEKENAKANAESDLVSLNNAKTSAGRELLATAKYIQSLHGECDWLAKYYDVRKDARAAEVDSLHQAKAVLSGADFALLQRTVRLRGGNAITRTA